jgi:REP element-mobilizing transposase RayT
VILTLNVLTHARLAWCGKTTLVVCTQAALTHLLSVGGSLVAELITRYEAICYAYCLMDNHYHLLLETPKANLSQIMRGLNGRYTRFFNKTRQRMGHMFQGRYKAIIVQKDNYLLELSRYIILNPVHAGIIDVPENYSWSSYSATIGQYACPG